MNKSKLFYIVLVLFILVLGLSYSIFISESKRVTASELLVGDLLYGINIYEDNSYTPIVGTQVTVPSNSSSDYYITVYSINPISSKFTLAYNNSNVTVEASSRSGWKSAGNLNEYSTDVYTKTIKVKVTNNTNSSQTVNFAAYGGYSYNALASINLGNGYIAVQSKYSDTFLLEGNTLVNVVKDDTNCEPTAQSPCLYGGDTEVNYFVFTEGGSTYRVLGNYLVNGEVLTKIIGPASSDSNIDSTTTFSNADYQKIGESDSYLGSDYSGLTAYFLNKDVVIVGSGTINDKFTITDASDLNFYTYEYLGTENPEPSLATLLQGIGEDYTATVVCSEGTSGTIDSSGIITFTEISTPARCKIVFNDYTNYTVTIVAAHSEEGTVNQSVVGSTQTSSTLTPVTGYTLTGATVTCESATPSLNASTGVLSITNITASQTCTATIPAMTLTVTFDANGGSGLSSSSKTVTYGGTYGTLPTIDSSSSCDEYEFTGWYTEAEGGTLVTSSTTVTVTSNQTLYAHRSFNGSCSGTTCTSWSSCSSNGYQTRSCTYEVNGVTYDDPSYTTQRACNSATTCTDWSTCSSDGYQTKTCTYKNGGVSHSSTTQQACNSATTCTSWSTCSSDGYQTRTCTFKNGGTTYNDTSQTTKQGCNSATTCTDWSTCSSSGTQTRTCTYKNAGVSYTDSSYTTTQSCTYCNPSESDAINGYRCYNGVNTYIYSCQPRCNSNPTCNGGTINRQSLKAACPVTYTCSKNATPGCAQTNGQWKPAGGQCYRTRSDLYNAGDDIGSWTTQVACKQNCTTSGYSCTLVGSSTWWCRKPASCSGGATLSNGTCYQYKAYDSYTCSEGTLSGTKCYLYNQTSTVSGWTCTQN